MKLLFSYILCATAFIHAVSCKKIVEIDAPKTSLVDKTTFANNVTATAVLTGIYQKMATKSDFAVYTGGISAMAGLSADEIKNYSTDVSRQEFYTNSLSIENTMVRDAWNRAYNCIYTANIALEGIQESVTLSSDVRNQLTGEAKFVRGFMYFYLVGLYGDVPLLLGSDYEKNAKTGRSSSGLVMQQAIADLVDAEKMLSIEYRSAGNEASTQKVRPNKAAAAAMLARAYLYAGEWQQAEQFATFVMSNTFSYRLTSLDEVFNTNSDEAIWQLYMDASNGVRIYESQMYDMRFRAPGSGTEPYGLSTSLVTSFETGDERRVQWVGQKTYSGTNYYFPAKYKTYRNDGNPEEFLTVLRLGEMYLVRAEARAQQGKLNGAESAEEDINAIRERAGLAPIHRATLPAIMEAIEKERRSELFTEWGHRWLDLKRWKGLSTAGSRLDEVMKDEAMLKGGTWMPQKSVFPIPNYDILKNPALIQNDGYKN